MSELHKISLILVVFSAFSFILQISIYRLAQLNDMEFRPVKVTGYFLNDRELYLGPRSFIAKGDSTSGSGLFSKDSKGIGYHVITPFQIDGREYEKQL